MATGGWGGTEGGPKTGGGCRSVNRGEISINGGEIRSNSVETEESERLARLVRTVEAEIVPRLVISRRIKVGPAPTQMGQTNAAQVLDVKELVRLLLSHDGSIASAYVDAVRQQGVTLEAICLELLAPAARELGLLWEEDECDFMEVTVGLCRLHQVLRELSPAFAGDDAVQVGDRRILLAAYPGDQHTFGITLVAQFLRRAGWDVWQEFPDTASELVEMARETSFAVVGLSVGCEARFDDVAETIGLIRKASRNRAIGVLIGGPMFVANPDLAAAVGADGTAVDGRDAVKQAEYARSGGWRREFGKFR